MIRLLLADDQTLFAESLKNILEMRTKDLKIVGLAYDGEQAVDLVERLAPEIVLMDVRMPKLDGVEAAKIIRQRHPQVKVMMLTTFDDDEYVVEAIRHGAVGYLLKTTRPAELITAIRGIKGGMVQISPEVARKLVGTGTHGGELALETTEGTVEENQNAPEPADWVRFLSHREKEILKQLLEGFKNRQIAERLFISEQTVKNHLHTIYSKMGVSTRFQAIKKVVEAGLNLSSY
ncbi:MAG: response regulator transcription factor [Spirochaetales bacterium]|nr:response regulator transcription factor [Spirochaetales bacterium]